jgi:AI-2E family transporter
VGPSYGDGTIAYVRDRFAKPLCAVVMSHRITRPRACHWLTGAVTARVITAVVFTVYTQIENHLLNPVIMSRTVKVNPLLVLVSVLVGAQIGSWVGGLFGGFTAALLAIPVAGALQLVVRDIWKASCLEDPARLANVAATTQVTATPPRRQAAFRGLTYLTRSRRAARHPHMPSGLGSR